MKLTVALLLWATLWACLGPNVAEAHTRRRSYSHWQWEGQSAQVRFRFDQRNLAEFLVGPGLETGNVGQRELERLQLLPAKLVERSLVVTQDSASCTIALYSDTATQKGQWLVIRGQVTCPQDVQSEGVTIEADLMRGTSLDHVHFMRVGIGDTESQIAFGTGNMSWSSSLIAGAPASALVTAGTMLLQGIIHLTFGYDHMAFLLTLILVSWFLRTNSKPLRGDLLAIALAFTLGHSLTLSLAATGTVTVSEPTVEFLIALSVAGLAWEGLLRSRPDSQVLRYGGAALLILLPALAAVGVTGHSVLSVAGVCVFLACYAAEANPGRWMRASVAASFGLLHGFGFAGALKEIGGTSAHLALSLASFNAGVEIGQWVAIGAVLLVLWLLRARKHSHVWLEAGCAVSLWLGTYWVMDRLI